MDEELAPESAKVDVNIPLRKIYMIGAIEESTVAGLAPLLDAFDRDPKPLDIVICSAGGSVEAGIAIYGMVRQVRSHVTMTGFGQVQSMASIIMQAADHRILEESCRFMIHDGTVESPETELQKHITRAKETEIVNNWCNNILVTRSRLSLKKITELSSRETYMSAAEAVKLGFADEVLKPRRRKWKTRS